MPSRMQVKPSPLTIRSTARTFSSTRARSHIGDGDRRGQIAEGDMVAAERLEREIGVHHLVVGIAVEQLGRLVVDHLAQHRGDRLALVEPLPAQLGQRLGGLGLVERDEARDPAIAEILMVEGVENPGPAEIGETEDGERAQMRIAQHRLQPAGERRVGQQPVQIDRRLRHRDGMAPRRDGAVEEGQGLGIVERPDLRHEARKADRARGRSRRQRRRAPAASRGPAHRRRARPAPGWRCPPGRPAAGR